MDNLYSSDADGLCGDEDNGQTSAWYVFSALGMYPVTPGSMQYVLGSPLFKKVILSLENGNTFIIHAPNNSASHVYIDKCTLNRKEYSKNYLEHRDIMKGGRIEFVMSEKANKNRGIKKEDAPFSVSR